VSEQQLPAQAPDFTLDHVLGHSVSLSDFRGRTVVAVFGGRDSAEQVKQAVQTIRRTHDPDQLPVLSVSDLEAVPRPARIIPKQQLKKAFEEAVQDLSATLEASGKQPSDDPGKDVIMLMDWKGEAVRGFGLSDVDHEAVAVVVDGNGRILGSGSGAQAGDEVLALVPSQ
jgi:cytochrome oxidase Cu insertion factor (SCO1/SenC/PrrC family)